MQAKIKFTEKKNIKFFSTWNKEGHLHDEDCPYNINYTEKKRIYGYFSKIWLSDEDVFRRLKRKMMEKQRKRKEMEREKNDEEEEDEEEEEEEEKKDNNKSGDEGNSGNGSAEEN